MDNDHGLPEFGTGLRSHLERHGVDVASMRAVQPTADLFALFAQVEPAPPTPGPKLRLRTA
jgi:hypothetical protein